MNWGQLTPDNFTPSLNITVTLTGTTWALNITGDTQGGNPINYSGSISTNALVNGVNNIYVGAEGQNEDPGINILIDRIVVTHLGSFVVTTPMFSTPEYGYNTNQVLAGEAVSLSSTVISGGTPTFQWQMEDSSAPGTFTNIPSATATNVNLNTSGLGDSQPRGLRLIATDGGNSVTSPAVALTVSAPVPPYIIQDTTPPGPEVRYVGLNVTYTAQFGGNHPMTNQWQKSPDAVTWTNIPNATNATLTLTNLQLSDAGYYRVSVTNSAGSTNSSASDLFVLQGTAKFNWAPPVSLIGLNADQILTNFPGTKIAGAMRGNGGPTTVTLSSGSPIVFAAPNIWASRTGGTGTGGGGFPGTNTIYTTTGNGNFNTCLANYYSDGPTHMITMSNLVVGKQYSLQLFALDGRSLNPGANIRTVNWQDPNDVSDISSMYSMADFVYLVGTFYASNTTESVQQNLLTNSGNFNCLVLRAVGFDPPPYMTSQPNNAGAYVGGTVVISGASAAGDATIANPTITYQWKAGPSGGPYTSLTEGSKFSGTTNTTLTINNAALADATQVYVLVVSNGGGSTTSREVTINVQNPPPHDLLGHWLTGTASLADTANFVAPGTFDGYAISNGIVGGGGSYYFTNDVPPGAPSGAQSLYLYNNDTGLIISNTATADFAYTNTFDDGMRNRFTIGFWAKGFPGTWNPWVSKNGENNGYQQRRNAANNYAILTVRGATAGADPGGNITSNDGQWHYYAGTFDTVTGLRNFYVDGRLSQQTTGNTPFSLPSASHLMIGARENGTFQAYYTGNIYDVRIYDYALSQSEIGTIGNVRPILTSQIVSGNNLVLTWPFGTLLEATNVTGPWTLTGATSPYTNNMTSAPQMFFMLSNP